MVTALAQNISALTAYLDRRNNQPACPLLQSMAPSNTLAALLHRYPLLFRGMITPPSATVEQLQQRVQAKVEIRLSRYVIGQMRRSQLTSATAPANPTLLSDFGLKTALQRFTGNVWEIGSHKDLARQFLRQTAKSSFGDFKQSLYDYLIAAIPASYRMQKFNQKLLQRLTNFMPEHHDQPLNTFLLTATCRNLFKFLTVENSQHLSHHTLIDLVSNLNPFFVAELCLRILLLCPHSRVHLDKRMALLFKHYATRPQLEVNWLIQVLEYLNLAYATNFGALTLPGAAPVKHVA
jgi:hypothetical protein